MARINKVMRRVASALLILFIGLLLLWVAEGNEKMLLLWKGFQHAVTLNKPDYSKNTFPLPMEVQEDLCQKFSIKNDDPFCQKGSIVYAFDFYPEISNYLYRLPEDKQRLEVVEEKIGEYQFKKEERVQGEARYIFYSYDFTGDQVYPLVIQFDEFGKIRRIYTGVNRDS